MNIRDRLLGPCALWDPSTEEVTVDIDFFLTRLLLFETFVVQSYQLKEIPQLFDILGFEGLMELLTTRVLRFHPFRLFAGYLERSAPDLPEDQMRYSLLFDENTNPQRPGFYEITNITVGVPEEEFHNYLQVVHEIPGITLKQKIRLKGALADSLIRIPKGFGRVSTSQTHLDLDRDPASVRLVLARLLSAKSSVSPSDIDLKIHREGEIALFVESNLTSTFGLDDQSAHRAIGNGLLAVDRLNVILEMMKLCGAISGFRSDELSYADEKIDFLVREVSPDAQDSRFQWVMEIFGLPDMKGAFEESRINTEKFLQVRKSRECSEFRAWLRNIDDIDEAELRERVDSLRARIGNAVHTKSGKALRLAATTGAGFVPVVGPIVGLVAGSLDAFLLEEVLPESGPVAFLTDLYPSIFKSGR